MTLTNLSTMSDSIVLFSSDDEESDSYYESKQYENFTSMLKGVPPPSSITISKFTVEEMLQKYNENQAFFGFGLESGNAQISSLKHPVPFFKYSNSSQISENIASIAQKVQERYVQKETMSSCNIWLKATLEACGSAKKRLRMRQGGGLSPGRRLSHLARRRQFFSSANLQRLASTENIRQIEIKKNSSLEGRKKIGRIVESDKLKSSKRALFLSPENGTPTKYGNTVAVNRKIYSSGSDEKRKLPLQEKSKKVEVQKWLSQQNFEIDLPRKRLREDCANHSVERKRKCPRRSLNFNEDDGSSNVATSDCNNSGDKKTGSSGKLSEVHKNKLLWAISVVLRENKITRNSEHFKPLAAKLFFTCRKNLDEILSMNTAEGTSDKILHFARKIIPSVFEELGIKPPENNLKAGKNDINVEAHKEDESKENINKSNVDRPSNCASNDIMFVFKTPKKFRQKRVIKSCQKAPNSGSKRKRNVLRRWRSLELLIKDAALSSATNLNVSSEKVCVSSDVRVNETIQSTDVSKCIDIPVVSLTSDGFYVPSSVIPNLPSVDTSVIFSPIPSSVKEESDNNFYSSHQTNKVEDEVPSDENSFSETTDESMVVENQDNDLRKGIKSLKEISVFPEEYNAETNPDVRDPSISEINLPQPPKVDVENEERESIARSETKPELSLIPTEFSHVTEENSNGSEIEKEKGEHDLKSDTNNEEWEQLTPELYSISQVEKGTYKPRKLVVKKTKPNWKVVRKNSEEEDELKLKMRLSHEWEVICRNSSCSDIGNNSECEMTSVNCSQMSSATDKEIINDNEVEDPSWRCSTQSKCDESVDEGIIKSNVLSGEGVKFRVDEFHDYKPNRGEIERLKCNEQAFIQAMSTPCREEFFSKSVSTDRFNAEVDDSNVETDCVPSEEDATVRKSTNPEGRRKEEKVHADEGVIVENSPFLFPKRRSGEKSLKKEKNFNASPETETKEDDYFLKRSRDREKSQYDSESGNSSYSNGPERKKILLSLENYKARKLEEASNNIKLNASNEESESKDVSSDRKSPAKKIYNIRLKHPMGHHKSKRKHKHKKYDREKKDKRKVREREKEETEGDNGLHLQALRQILGGFCEEDHARNLQVPQSENKDVNIQTIVDALSALSNLVQEQIKLENDRMNTEFEGNASKKSNWLDVVLSWCGRNLNNLKLANASSLPMEGLDSGSVAAMKKVLNLSMSQPLQSVSSVNGNVDSIDSRNLLKTEHKPAQDCIGPTSSQPVGYSNNLTQIPNNRAVQFQDHPGYSSIASQSGFNYRQPFSAEGANVFRKASDIQPRDPRRDSYSWSKIQHIDSAREYPSMQAPYQCPSVTAQKFYQPNLYNYSNWQGDVSSWNYHQSEGYQNSAFYPYQTSNLPYYTNKY